MTRGQSASWLPPLGINNTAIWVSPHTPVLSGSVPQQRLKHWGRGGGQETGGFEKRGSFEGKTVLQHIPNRRYHTWDALRYSHVDQNSSTLEWHISFCRKKTCLFQGMLMSDSNAFGRILLTKVSWGRESEVGLVTPFPVPLGQRTSWSMD